MVIDMYEELKARLRAFNEWRRGEDFSMPSPKQIGEDIDAAIEAIEQLERQLAERGAEIAKYREAPVVEVVSHSRMGLNSNLLNTALRVGTKLIVKPGEQ